LFCQKSILKGLYAVGVKNVGFVAAKNTLKCCEYNNIWAPRCFKWAIGSKSAFFPRLGELVEVELFAAALGLQSPWYVSGLDFSLAKKNLDINIDFKAGSLP